MRYINQRIGLLNPLHPATHCLVFEFYAAMPDLHDDIISSLHGLSDVLYLLQAF